MRRVIAVSMAAFMLAAFAFSGIALANCGKCSAAEKGEVVNTACPVMGDKVDKNTANKVEYKGKTIGFCCPGCIEKFNADPEKYMAKISEDEKCIIKCPSCGTEIDVKEECQKRCKQDVQNFGLTGAGLVI